MSANEGLLAYEFLASTLKGDATLMGYIPGGVYRNEAPPASSTPYIILSFQSGKDTTTMNGVRIFATLMMQVRIVGPASQTASTLVPAASRIDTLLGRVTGNPLTADNLAIILTCYRDRILSQDTIMNGELWSSIGGFYYMEVQAIG